MTAPIAPRGRRAHKALPPAPATELAVPIGPRVLEVLEVAYRARRPVLLEGPTGIGKSQIVSELARAIGIEIIVVDLSLLEPPDLVGLPIIEGGRTRYASPAELPTSGRGVLMLEELNRAELPVMQPALQLLSARRLHGYELPPGWFCVAAVNPEDGDYQVNTLDPALRSRFLQLSVCADRDAWLAWAVRANVHPIVQRVVRDSPEAFEHASPRSWAYAAELLHALRAAELGDRELVRVVLRGYLPTSWAMLVAEALAAYPPAPDIEPDALFADDGAARLAATVRALESAQRVDAIAMLAAKVRRILAHPELASRVENGTVDLESLERLLAPFPGDLRDQCLETAVESPAKHALLGAMGHTPAAVAHSYRSSPLRASVQAWRRAMKLHRVRLVVAAVVEHLAETELVGDPAQVDDLTALAEDGGPLAGELARWLRARSGERLAGE